MKKIIGKFHVNSNQIASRAYVINEDRLYLFPVFDLSKMITSVSHFHSSEYVNNFIHILIRSCQRSPTKNEDNLYISDIRVFEEGFTYICLDESNHFQIIFILDKHKFSSQIHSAEDFHININCKRIAIDLKINNQFINITSKKISSDKLAINFTRDNTFIIRKYLLYFLDDELSFTDFYIKENELTYYL